MSAVSGLGSDSSLEPRAAGGEAARQGVETVFRPSAEIEPTRIEPPPHLRGALRAAAAARDRAQRIRGVAPAPTPPTAPAQASRPPPELPARRAWSDPVQPTGLRNGEHADNTRFARTSAAAQQLRAALAQEAADVLLHLRLRDEVDGASRILRWLSRLLNPLGLRTRSAPDRLLVPGPASDAARGLEPRHTTGAPRPTALDVATAIERTATERSVPFRSVEEESATREVLRLPPLGRNRLDREAALAPRRHSSSRRESAAPAPELRATPPPGGGSRDLAHKGPKSFQDLSHLPHQAQYATARAFEQLASARRLASWSGTTETTLPVAQTTRNLPVPYTSAGVPIRRLADLLARSQRPRAEHRGRAGPGRATGKAAPSDPTISAALISPLRCLMLAGTLAAGFALGIIAYGTSPLSGTRSGEALLGPDAEAPSEEHPPAIEGAPLGPAAELRAPAPAGDARAAPNAAGLGATGSVDAAATGRAPPQTPPSGVAAASPAAPDASSSAIARGPVDFGLPSRATAGPAARSQASAADWQVLYTEGHRYQLAGNLVAAADAYRRALGMNPRHAAIHYDLGYVLQMQGQVEAAVDHYRRAVALQPDHGYAHYNLGYLLQALGDSAAALEHYELAAARLPDNAFVYYDWGWSLELSGDRAGAAALYRKAIALNPQDRPGIDARRRLAALGRSARLE